MKIVKSKLPSDSLMNRYLPANFTDTYSCEVAVGNDITPDDIMISFWTNPPKWIESLFNLRNKMVKIVGLKGADQNKGESQRELIDCIKEGRSYGMFSVEGKSENETVLKLTDKHLDAYISAFVTEVGNKRKVSISTVVDIHNWLGYIYFYSICPFHKIVVKGMMRHIFKEG